MYTVLVLVLVIDHDARKYAAVQACAALTPCCAECQRVTNVAVLAVLQACCLDVNNY